MAARSRRAWFGVLLGLVLGFTLASRLILPKAAELAKANPGGGGCAGLRAAAAAAAAAASNAGGAPWQQSSDDASSSSNARSSSFLFVGVMTAQKYLNSRAVAAHRTWARSIPGRVEFFSSEGSDAAATGVPVVALSGVDDSYPPQKKSFMMLKYMHDHYLERFEWFMRADDDVYVKGERLESFLRGLNSSAPVFLGQTGMGARDELGKLALEPGQNFCMGGPGVVMSREVLRRVAPHLRRCLRQMHTAHEDVEVGRCVRRFAGVQCVWSYEMQQLFHENYEPNKRGFIRELRDSKIHRAITLHPNKSPPHQYRLHSYLLSQKVAALRQRSVRLHRELLLAARPGTSGATREDRRLGAPPSFTRFRPGRRSDVTEWDFLSARHIFTAWDGQPPRRGTDAAQRRALDDVVMQVMEMINANAKTRGRVIDFKEIQYGYRRVDPLHGAEYVLDLLLLYKKHKGKSVTVPVRRHAYLQQSFSRAHFCEERPTDAAELAVRADRSSPSFLSLDSLKMLAPFLPGRGDGPSPPPPLPADEKVNVLVPLAGRYETFARFMANVERVCLIPRQNVKLVVLLFGDDNATERVRQAEVELLRRYHIKYPRAELEIKALGGSFSRALALEVGAARFPNASLLFFCDVDLLFTADFLQRCRANAVAGRFAYFPVVFSQYDPLVAYGGRAPDDLYTLTSEAGLWRNFGFGVVCARKGDLLGAGGLDTSIRGWGLEDVDLYDKFVRSGAAAPFRSVDPGIVHVHHAVTCDSRLEPKQYKMCLGSRAASRGSAHRLAKLWLDRNQGASVHANVSLRTA
ncbi:chondroitin sulfate synthase 1-like isoform X2 [Corythoichthys intestinalis]|uniref:chondroitin sulfate synthase 1-like isoform X2 n=1 Tax=Corythoichthys intestinalis TaxID=161448 RepID=UPI0025A62F0A|nr:chondroitin sulfate synthase 1-like isoform X2 [Corythoichthys intestinalis]XP_057685137.1 chondroitin sulfate synthase 1-like isoform X2 [Corythoichthys intestinalis]